MLQAQVGPPTNDRHMWLVSGIQMRPGEHIGATCVGESSGVCTWFGGYTTILCEHVHCVSVMGWVLM